VIRASKAVKLMDCFEGDASEVNVWHIVDVNFADLSTLQNMNYETALLNKNTGEILAIMHKLMELPSGIAIMMELARQVVEDAEAYG